MAKRTIVGFWIGFVRSGSYNVSTAEARTRGSQVQGCSVFKFVRPCYRILYIYMYKRTGVESTGEGPRVELNHRTLA